MTTTTELLAKYDQFANPVVEDFDRRMMDSMLLSINGNDKARIGEDNKRRDNPFLEEAENLLLDLVPLPLTCDIRPIHPPFFREFSYTDMMGGVMISSLSAEVSARVKEEASKLKADRDFPIEETMDKYMADAPTRQTFKKVIFMPGSNLLDVIDSSMLTRMALDDEWVVKPHPVSNDNTIKDLIAMFGGDRILPKRMSGHGIFNGAEEVATTAASEFSVKAILSGKKLHNMTLFNQQDSLTYGAITRLLTGDAEQDWHIVNNALMSDLSGYLLADNGTQRNTDLIKMYAGRVMEIRENFRMVTTQRLLVNDLYPNHWNNRPGK